MNRREGRAQVDAGLVRGLGRVLAWSNIAALIDFEGVLYA